MQWVAVFAISFLKNLPMNIQPIKIFGMQLCGHTMFKVAARNLNHKGCYFPIDTSRLKKKESQSPLFTCCDCFFLVASKVSCNRMWAACRRGGQPGSQPVHRKYLRRVMMEAELEIGANRVSQPGCRFEGNARPRCACAVRWGMCPGRKALLHPARHSNVPTDDTEACVTLPLRYSNHLFSTDIALNVTVL